jgi:parallel beta-helix repeat protein
MVRGQPSSVLLHNASEHTISLPAGKPGQSRYNDSDSQEEVNVNRTLPGQIARVCILPALLLAPALRAQVSVSCGDTVGQDTVLTANLVCPPGPGLIVGADGITIDLGNKTISCLGFPLECQGNSLAVGINVGGHKNVTIKGGTITGFDTGIKIDGGDRVNILGLTVTGPPSDSALYTHRGAATGILVENSACPRAIVVDGNDVSWHRFGLRLVNSSCVKIQRNIIHENNNDADESFGVFLLNSGGNTLTNNSVTDNGFNNSYEYDGKFDAGIALEGAGTTGNRISQNTVQYNCGDGIAARPGAAGNTISNNTVAFNPIPNSTGNFRSCLGAPASPNLNFDLAARDPASDNRWSKTNDCGVSFGILPGVCIVSK